MHFAPGTSTRWCRPLGSINLWVSVGTLIGGLFYQKRRTKLRELMLLSHPVIPEHSVLEIYRDFLSEKLLQENSFDFRPPKKSPSTDVTKPNKLLFAVNMR